MSTFLRDPFFFFFFFFFSLFFVLSFFPAGSCGFWIFVACMRAKPQFRQHFIFTLVHIRAHGFSRSVSDFFFFILSQLRLVGFGFLSRACARNRSLAPVTPEFDFPSCSKSLRSRKNPCPNHNNVRVPSAYAHQRIHAQTIIPFVFQEHTVTKASMPTP